MKDLFQQRKTYVRFRNLYIRNGGEVVNFRAECERVRFGNSPEDWIEAAEKVIRAKVIETYEKEACLAGLTGEM